MLAIWLFAACDSGENERIILAQVDDQIITEGEFAQRFREFTMLTPIDEPHVRQALLRNMIDEQTLVLEAQDQGVTQSREYLEYAERVRIDEMLDAYQNVIADTAGAVTNDDVLQAFALGQEKARARHLFAPTKAEAETLYERLQNGEPFETLAKEVFRDPKLSESGGDLGFFEWDDMDQMFAAAAQNLKTGEISRPVKTRYGYSIIKLEQRFRNPILLESEFAKQKDKLHWQQRHRVRAQMLRDYGKQKLAELNPRYVSETLDFLWQKMQDSRSATFQLAAIDPEKFDAAFLNHNLVSMEGQTWTIRDFIEKAQRSSERQRRAIRTKEALVEFVNGLAIRARLIEEAEARGLDGEPSVQAKIRRRTERFLVQKMRKMVTDTVRVPEDSIRAAYQSNPQQYVFPKMVNVREITVATKREADSLLALLKNGADFGDLARKNSLREWTRNKGGEIGFVRKGDLGGIGESVFGLKKNEIGGPFQTGDRFILMQKIDERPERQKPYEEARSEIIESLVFYSHMDVLKRRIDAWKKERKITFDHNKLQSLKSPLRIAN